LEVDLLRIDERSVSNLGYLYEGLSNYGLDYIKDWKGESLGKFSLSIDSKENEENSLQLDFAKQFSEIPPGIYVAVFDSPELRLAGWETRPTQWFQRTNLGINSYSGIQQTTVEIRNFSDLHPVRLAEVEVIAKNNRLLFKGEADDNGQVVIPNSFLRGEKGNSPAFLLARSPKHGLSLIEFSDLKKKPRFLIRGRKQEIEQDLYLTTDRDWYRNGEEVHFVVVGRDLKLKPLPEYQLNANLVNPQGELSEKVSLKLDEFGVAKGEFFISNSALHGPWTLEIKNKSGQTLATQKVAVRDLVPLTLETAISTDNESWRAGEGNRFEIQSNYYSGGQASLMSGDYRGYLKALNQHESAELKDFYFGNPKAENRTYEIESKNFQLNSEGIFFGNYKVDDLSGNPQGLYELDLRVNVQDLGGRPNPKNITIPIDTHSAYLGVRPNFQQSLATGISPQFELVRVNRSGGLLPLLDLDYKLSRIEYSYDWYYNNGWRWNRSRAAERSIKFGRSQSGQINDLPQLDWGNYELSVSDISGFVTTYEFSVGWGADGQSTADPEEVVLSTELGPNGEYSLRFEAPFAGLGTILLANGDLIDSSEVAVKGGRNEFKFTAPEGLEPGFHVLLNLRRPVEQGTEHLPQIALGSTWVEVLSADRRIEMTMKIPDQITSDQDLAVLIQADVEEASVVLFAVDEGIHAINDFQNKDLLKQFFGERQLALGILGNYGQLIKQDPTLPKYSVGGDGNSFQTARSIRKSDFFKTISLSSPVLKLKNGQAFYSFPVSGFEGRIRIVGLLIGEHGLGMETGQVKVTDPVSLETSLPRFLGVGDQLKGKIGLRAKQNIPSLNLRIMAGSQQNDSELSIQQGKVFKTDLQLSMQQVGTLPVRIELEYEDRTIQRNFELVSRLTSYPQNELRSVSLTNKLDLSSNSRLIPPLQIPEIDWSQPESVGITTTVSLHPGAGISMLLAALDRYPYGCLEQLSSVTRGLVYREKLQKSNDSQHTNEKIKVGIERILALQRPDGAFGYWSQFGEVREEFQPYVLETLLLALPYLANPQQTQQAVSKGLERLSQQNSQKLTTKLQSLGLLHLAGYEVKSRIRYAIDQELGKGLNELLNQKSLLQQEVLERLGLGYWLASILEDKMRQAQILLSLEQTWPQSDAVKVGLSIHQGQRGWQKSHELYVGRLANRHVATPQASVYLSQLPAKDLSPLIQLLMDTTKSHLGVIENRSTLDNARLAELLFLEQKEKLPSSIKLDGKEYPITVDGEIKIPLDLLRSGFVINQVIDHNMFLNVELVGQNRSRERIQNGFNVTKRIFDKSGKEIQLSRTNLELRQGDLLSVLVEFESTLKSLQGDLVITDLLPSGFELMEGYIPSELVSLNGKAFRLNTGEDYSLKLRQDLDDRIMVHYQDDWVPKNRKQLAYTIRASYPGKMVLPDAHVELMYQPEINGRSVSQQLLVLEQ